MNGNKAVLDSNFLIYISKGLIDLNHLRSTYDELYVSIVTYIEVYGYRFSNSTEKAVLDNVFAYLKRIDVSSAIAEKTIEYRQNDIRKIKLPDALILATAKSIGADLITNNQKDFENIDATVSLVDINRFVL
jgi:predicted nucleic acid-binding protein